MFSEGLKGDRLLCPGALGQVTPQPKEPESNIYGMVQGGIKRQVCFFLLVLFCCFLFFVFDGRSKRTPNLPLKQQKSQGLKADMPMSKFVSIGGEWEHFNHVLPCSTQKVSASGATFLERPARKAVERGTRRLVNAHESI